MVMVMVMVERLRFGWPSNKQNGGESRRGDSLQ